MVKGKPTTRKDSEAASAETDDPPAAAATTTTLESSRDRSLVITENMLSRLIAGISSQSSINAQKSARRKPPSMYKKVGDVFVKAVYDQVPALKSNRGQMDMLDFQQGIRVAFNVVRVARGQLIEWETSDDELEGEKAPDEGVAPNEEVAVEEADNTDCLLYTSPSPRDRTRSRMPSSA